MFPIIFGGQMPPFETLMVYMYYAMVPLISATHMICPKLNL